MNSLNNKYFFLFLVMALRLNTSAVGQKLDLVRLAKQNGFTLYNRSMQVIQDGNRQGIRLEQQDADAGVAWLNTTSFSQGTIDLDIRGKDVLQRSFVGIAFHGKDDKTYEAIYFRPFNFRAEDPVRHRHAVQYISLPAYDWPTLRKDHPDQYENAVNPAPEPNGWFHARIVVDKETISVFVNANMSPSLVVKKLTDTPDGKIGLWVGSGSGGDFANLKITPGQ